MAPFAAVPLHLSQAPDDTDLSAAHLGAEMLGLPLLPQGEIVARVLEAKKGGSIVKPLYRQVATAVPRRSTKTTAIWSVILGRCLTQDDHKVVVTAQDRTRASNLMKEVMRILDRRHPDPKNLRDFSLRPFYLAWSQGGETIVFQNGSRIWCVKPRPEAFRGESADTIFFDEAGELDPDESADLVAGALPLMDTRPQGQIIIAGTPGPSRAGLFWDSLDAGRSGTPGKGVIEFAARDTDDPTDEALWWRVHPGLASGLTDIDIIRERYETMPLPQFSQEYLCVWAPDATTSVIASDLWESLGGVLQPLPSQKWALGYDCSPDGSRAAICAGWYDDQGLPHVQVLAHRQGMSWVAGELIKASAAHRRLPVAYDPIGQNLTIIEDINRAKARVNTQPLTMREMSAAAVSLVRSAEDHVLHHAAQPSLDTAVQLATWRMSNDSRLFNRRKGDITCIVAASSALFLAGRQREKSELMSIVQAG